MIGYIEQTNKQKLIIQTISNINFSYVNKKKDKKKKKTKRNRWLIIQI